jgi:hypothetical protein
MALGLIARFGASSRCQLGHQHAAAAKAAVHGPSRTFAAGLAACIRQDFSVLFPSISAQLFVSHSANEARPGVKGAFKRPASLHHAGPHAHTVI